LAISEDMTLLASASDISKTEKMGLSFVIQAIRQCFVTMENLKLESIKIPRKMVWKHWIRCVLFSHAAA